MTQFEKTIEQAVADGVIAGVVLLARDKSGKLNYTHSHGYASLSPSDSINGSLPPMTPDTLFALASLTKLLTTVAVLQQVERGALSLDQDVSPFLPDLAAKEVIRPAAGKAPMGFEPRTETITLRQLLNHSSGAGYDFLDPRLKAPASARKFSPPGDGPKANPKGTVSLEEHLYYNLSFQPGTSWTYGSGVSWAGRCLEVVTGKTLEECFVENIFKPLGIPEGSITFFPDNGATQLPRASLTERHEPPKPKTKPDAKSQASLDPDAPPTTIKASPATSMPWNPYTNLSDCLGGEGAFGAPGQFIKVMESLLRDDGLLLKPETTKLMFEGSLEPEPKRALRKSMETPEWVVGDIPPTGEYDWGLGGLLVDGDSHPWRRRGCLMWSGMFNSFWFIDRAAGLCGLFGAQVLPPGDPLLKQLIKGFEEDMYSRVRPDAHM